MEVCPFPPGSFVTPVSQQALSEDLASSGDGPSWVGHPEVFISLDSSRIFQRLRVFSQFFGARELFL